METKYLTVDGRSLLLTKMDNEWTTTTLELAKTFDKTNHHIMSNFKKTHIGKYESFRAATKISGGSYLDGNNQSRPMWLLKEEAFLFIIVNLTGAVASSYKGEFVNEFILMRDALSQEQLTNLGATLAVNTKINDVSTALAESALSHDDTMRLGVFANSIAGNYLDLHISVQTIYSDLRELDLIYQTENVVKVAHRDLLTTVVAKDKYDCVRVNNDAYDRLLNMLVTHWISKGIEVTKTYDEFIPSFNIEITDVSTDPDNKVFKLAEDSFTKALDDHGMTTKYNEVTEFTNNWQDAVYDKIEDTLEGTEYKRVTLIADEALRPNVVKACDQIITIDSVPNKDVMVWLDPTMEEIFSGKIYFDPFYGGYVLV